MSKILFLYNAWRGGFIDSIKSSFEKLGFETKMTPAFPPSFKDKVLKKIKLDAFTNSERSYDEFILNQINEFEPKYIFTQNGVGISHNLYSKLKSENLYKFITVVVDSPFSNARSNFAINLKFQDYILNPEDDWSKFLNYLAPNAKIIKFLGGYEPNNFYDNSILPENIERFSKNVVFTGNSYKGKPEGIYRASVMAQIAEKGIPVTLYGDEGWKHWFKYYPILETCFNGERLSYPDYINLLKYSNIYINMPSPQITSAFQPRVFEIAATKGFQLIDYSKDLKIVFDESKIATFNSIPELIEKIEFYTAQPMKRKDVVEYMYDKVVEEYTWESQVRVISEKIGIL